MQVSLRLPGASPDEMTSAVIMPMENALSGIAGIDDLRANVNAGGTANITVRFLLGRDLDDAANTVREKVAGAMRNVPPEVLPPVIQKQDPDAEAIMSIVISGKTASLRTLTEIADKQVKRALESVDGVGAVTMSGDRLREIHIVVDVEKLNAHGLTIDQVRDAIQKRTSRFLEALSSRASGRSGCARLAASMPPSSSTTSSSRRSTASLCGCQTSATRKTRFRRSSPRSS